MHSADQSPEIDHGSQRDVPSMNILAVQAVACSGRLAGALLRAGLREPTG